jgi:hypothetical protein
MSSGVDVRRVEQLAELRDVIKALPVRGRRVLKDGPSSEPHCGVCSALAAADGCASYARRPAPGRAAPPRSATTTRSAASTSSSTPLSWRPAPRRPLVRALAGALAAERCLTVYLLAGWVPPRIRRPAADRGSWPLPEAS